MTELKMGLKLTHKLSLGAAFLAAALFSTAANATTYDVSFSLSAIPGNTLVGSGFGVFENSVNHPNIFSSDDLSVSITETGKDGDTDTFDFTNAFATFNNAGKLTSLTGFDSITGGDSVTLGFLGGLFADADYCTTDGNSCGRRDKGPHDTLFAISGAVATNAGLTSTPLPTTWPMMLFGLLGLGLVAHRRASKKSASCAVA
jgi:hypothetical protein